MAFKIMDRDGSGQLDMEDVKGVYNAKSHPDVVQGRKTEDEILRGLVEAFEVGSNKDCVVSVEEFENYYANISASIDSDDYFELMIRNAWHISGGEGVYANSTNRRVLVTRADGSQAVEEVKNDIGVRASDKEAMIAKLRAQGLNVGTINLNGSAGMNNQTEARDRAQPQYAPANQTGSRSNIIGSQHQQQNHPYQQNQQNQFSNQQPQQYQQQSMPSNRSGQQSGPQRLSGFVEQSSINSHYQQNPSRGQQQGGGSVSGGAVNKPVRLSDLVASSDSNGGHSQQQTQTQRPQSGGGYRR